MKLRAALDYMWGQRTRGCDSVSLSCYLTRRLALLSTQQKYEVHAGQTDRVESHLRLLACIHIPTLFRLRFMLPSLQKLPIFDLLYCSQDLATPHKIHLVRPTYGLRALQPHTRQGRREFGGAFACHGAAVDVDVEVWATDEPVGLLELLGGGASDVL